MLGRQTISFWQTIDTCHPHLSFRTTSLEESNVENRHQAERQSSPEARTTDSGYISPPEIMSNEPDIKQPQRYKDMHTCDQTCSKESRNCTQHMTTDLDEVDEKYFDSFLYWRTPLPQVELEPEEFVHIENIKPRVKKLELSAEASAIGSSETSRTLEIHHHSNLIHHHQLQHHHHHPKLSFMDGDDDSDEEDSTPLYSLTDDFHGHHVDHSIGRFDYDDYRKLNLGHTSSFEEDLLIADHITAPPVQVLSCPPFFLPVPQT